MGNYTIYQKPWRLFYLEEIITVPVSMWHIYFKFWSYCQCYLIWAVINEVLNIQQFFFGFLCLWQAMWNGCVTNNAIRLLLRFVDRFLAMGLDHLDFVLLYPRFGLAKEIYIPIWTERKYWLPRYLSTPNLYQIEFGCTGEHLPGQ